MRGNSLNWQTYTIILQIDCIRVGSTPVFRAKVCMSLICTNCTCKVKIILPKNEKRMDKHTPDCISYWRLFRIIQLLFAKWNLIHNELNQQLPRIRSICCSCLFNRPCLCLQTMTKKNTLLQYNTHARSFNSFKLKLAHREKITSTSLRLRSVCRHRVPRSKPSRI